MSYNLIDLRRQKVIGTYETEAQAIKAESHLMHEPGQTWYSIEAPVVKKTRTRKSRVKKESD